MKDIPSQLTFKETTEEYKRFVDKFKPKKTTDDCFTHMRADVPGQKTSRRWTDGRQGLPTRRTATLTVRG